MIRAFQRHLDPLAKAALAETHYFDGINDAYGKIRERQKALVGQALRFLIICDGNLIEEKGDDLLEAVRPILGDQLARFIFHSDDDTFRQFADGERVIFIHKDKCVDLIPRVKAFLT